MTEIEPIITKWLLSPIGLIVAAIVIILAIVLTLASMFNNFPSKE